MRGVGALGLLDACPLIERSVLHQLSSADGALLDDRALIDTQGLGAITLNHCDAVALPCTGTQCV